MLRHIATRNQPSPPASLTAVARRTRRSAALVVACVAALSTTPAALAATAPKTPLPTAWTNDVSNVVDSYATLNGTILAPASSTFYFEYGETTAYGTNTTSTPVSSSGLNQLEAATVPVAPGEEYHYQFVASDKTGTVSGGDQVFFTQPDPPVIGSAVGGAFLPGVLDGGVPLLLRLDSPGTITVQVFIPASVAVANHVITHAPTGVSLVWIGSNRVTVDPFQLAYDSVPVSQRAAKLLSKLPKLTLTIDATAQANGVVSNLAQQTIVLKNRPKAGS